MRSREELVGESARHPRGVAEYAFELQEQLMARDQALARKDQLLAEKERLLAEQEQLLAEARAYIAELKRQLFGPKADKLTPEQEEQLRQLAGDVQEQAQRPAPLSREVLEPEVLPEEEPRPSRPRRHLRPAVPLEVRREVLEPVDKTCEHCHRERPCIGQEVSTEYDYQPAKLVAHETVRPKYGQCPCGCGQSGVVIAPLPPRLVPQSKLGLGLAVYILLSRFDDHVAYYTLERIFRERHGVIIPRQQMVRWVEQIAFLLLAIYHLIWEGLVAGDYLQLDETPVKVLDPEVKGKAATGFLWFFSAPRGDAFLEFCDGRGQDHPRQRLLPFKGTIQTDAYQVYKSLQRERPLELKRLGCLAHTRRLFRKAAGEASAEAIWFIAQIRQLYRIEDEVREASPEERTAVRRQKAPAFWRAMKRHALELQAEPRFLPQSSLGKAVNYFLKEYTPLVGYLRDGRFEIDNNLVENDIRPEAVGRRRWLFIGHPDAGWRSAVIYTIILSCRRRGINPQEYLTDVLRRLPAMKNSEVKDLVPSRWKPPVANGQVRPP
ncbi:MAG TPA: IS66 family transposase [Dongiaceae bacterium]|nr:IS66 family transposase [Dongiaceae bacterium]